jgi:hypothetical protein
MDENIFLADVVSTSDPIFWNHRMNMAGHLRGAVTHPDRLQVGGRVIGGRC